MAREDTLLREIATQLDGQVAGNSLVLPKRGCVLRLRIVAWRCDDENVAREWNVRLSSSRESPPSRGAQAVAAYRCVERTVVHGHPEIELQLRSQVETFGNFMDMDKPIETGEEPFDAEVYVASDSPPEQVLAALADTTARDEIRKLLEAGCATVKINVDGEELTTTIWVGEDDGQLVPIAEGLCRLHAVLPRFEGDVVRPSRWRETAMTMSFLLVVVGVILSALGVHVWEPMHFTDSIAPAAAGLVAWVVLVPFAFLLFRGRPRAARTFVSVIGPALIGLPLFFFGGAICLNGGLDTRDRKVERVEVIGKNTSHDDHSIILQVSSAVPLEIDVDADFLTGLHNGDEVELIVGAGWFGWPWVDGVRKPKP